MVVRVSALYVSSRSCGGLGAAARCPCLASLASIKMHIASLRKDQNLKFTVCFLLNEYCFNTIVKLKNHKLNYPKLKAICTDFLPTHIDISPMWSQQILVTGWEGLCIIQSIRWWWWWWWWWWHLIIKMRSKHLISLQQSYEICSFLTTTFNRRWNWSTDSLTCSRS